MMRTRDSLRIWVLSHRLSPLAGAGYLLGWVVVVALCYVGLPKQLAPEPASGVSLQVLGMVALAAISALPAFWLDDAMAWLTGVTSRPLVWMRLAWAAGVITAHLALAAATIPFLPRGFDVGTGYLAISALWLGVAMTARVWWGPTAGALVPLAVAVLLTTTIIPWNYNPVFNGEFTTMRIGLAVVFLLTGCLRFARGGARAG